MWTTRTLAEAAAVDPSAIRHLIARGRLEADKLGRDWIIDPHEAQRYIQQRRSRGLLPPNEKTATLKAPQSEQD